MLVGSRESLPGEALPSVMKKAIEAAVPGATRRPKGTPHERNPPHRLRSRQGAPPWEPENPYVRLIPDPVARKRFLADICNGDWLIQTDRGMDWPEAETALIARHPEHEAMIRAFRRNWHEMVPGLVEGTPEILESLVDDGRDVTALTNFAADTFVEVKPRFPILDRFRGVTVSAHTGYAKPEPDIYRHHAEAFGLSPPHVLFFDDMHEERRRRAGSRLERRAVHRRRQDARRPDALRDRRRLVGWAKRSVPTRHARSMRSG